MPATARTAIVTGAGEARRAEIAEALLADGWTWSRTSIAMATTLPRARSRSSPIFADPGMRGSDFRRGAGLPPVRLLVNNAARFAWDGPGDSAGEFDAHMAVNLRAPVLLTDRFAALHDGTGDGLVVNMLDAKLAAPNPDFLSYTLSKHALAAVPSLPRGRSPKGVRVNGIAPALMLRSPGQSEENYEAMHAPIHSRAGSSPAMSSALRYLIAPAVTGQVLTIDGGQRFWSLAARRAIPGEEMIREMSSWTGWCPTTSRCARRASCSIRSRSRSTSASTISKSARRSGCWSRVEIWLEDVAAPAGDDPALALDYDYFRSEVERSRARAATTSRKRSPTLCSAFAARRA